MRFSSTGPSVFRRYHHRLVTAQVPRGPVRIATALRDQKRGSHLSHLRVSSPKPPIMADLSMEESRAKLKQQFAKFSGDQYTKGWADFWEKGDFLPWDRPGPSPALIDTLDHYTHLIGGPFIEEDGQKRRKRALVPGCGRGVDVLLLQRYGYDVTGLEVSPGAVEAFGRLAQEKESEQVPKDETVGLGNKQVVLGDFYSDDWLAKAGLKDGEKFELIYDYTFFCAMNPSMRPSWAKRMSRLLSSSPQANLICLEFPTNKPVSAGGPPFSSPSKAYMEHLTQPGVDIPYTAEGEVKINPFAEISRDGLERLPGGYFHPADSHKIGKDADGNVQDFISIWRHRF